MVDRVQGVAGGRASGGSEMKERALDFAATAKEQFSGGTGAIKEYIVNRPVRALGIALGMGVLLGWLIKRR